MNLKDYIIDIPDFPIEGIMFRDITSLIGNGKAFAYTTHQLTTFAKNLGATIIVGPEARGFIFGTPVAVELEVPFIPVRKPGKLPRATTEIAYDLEYGKNTLCIHTDAIKPGDKVVIVDDLLATGGTINASIELIEKLGGEVVGLAFVIELIELEGRKHFNKDIEVLSLVQY